MIVTLRIFLFGLIALVPQDGLMTALLIDARVPPGDTPNGCHFHRHQPVLALHPSNVAGDCPQLANFRNLCAWQLERDQIELPQFIGAAPLTLRGGLRGRALTFDGIIPKIKKIKLPKDQEDGADFSWVPEMDVVSGISALELNPININPHSAPGDAIVSRVFFNQGLVETCHLAQLQQFGGNDAIEGEPCEGSEATINVFEFRSLDGERRGPSQALADGMVITIEGTPSLLAMIIRDFFPRDGDGPDVPAEPTRINVRSTSCNVGVNRQCIDVLVLNVPGRHQVCPSVGTDFALLYLAALNPPDLRKRSVPYRTGQCINAAEVPASCDSVAVRTLFSGGPTPEGRPICPMGVY